MPEPTCPRCQRLDSAVRYDLGSEKIVRCSHCRLLFLHPWPKPEETEAVYGDSYFENPELLKGDTNWLFGYADYIAERLNKQPQYAAIAREMRSLLPPLSHPPRLLEVGCGLGYFLNEAFEEEFSPVGIEFNHWAVARLRRKFAFPILFGALEKVDLESDSFDAAAMFDVIEHMRNPFLCLDKLYDALAPGGLLAISTPDAESWSSRLIGSRLEDFRRTREHLFFFGRETLSEVLDEHGFDVLGIRSIGHTFDLTFLLERLALYNRPVFTTLRRFFEAVGLGSIQLRINPRTKMIALARKRASRRPLLSPGATKAVADDVADLDRLLIDELETLEKTTPRHYAWVCDMIAPHLGRAVFEVGSGIGVISKHLVPRCEHLVLSDHQEVYLRRLRERFGALAHVDYRILDLTDPSPDLAGKEIDTVVCLNVLEHIEDDQAALRGLAGLLPVGGRLILQVPNFPSFFGSLDESYGHFRRYSPRSLEALLQQAGFRQVHLRRFNTFSIPGWFLSGRILRTSRLDSRSLRLYDSLVPILRRLDPITRVAGLSLIAVAEKS